MTVTKKKRGVAPCASCAHRWGRHAGGIGSCAEPGCSCSSFVTKAHLRDRARVQGKAQATRRRPLTEEEWRAFLDAAERVLGADWQRPRLRAEGVDPREALAELGLAAGATAQDVVRAFRRRALEVHPDQGGDAEAFKRLVRVRDAALAAVGGGR
ncbi:MAG: J domain-containing protein [Planctomycetes bacterium]|nr:J domain-containing protein [Planctomycetota bacterium]